MDTVTLIDALYADKRKSERRRRYLGGSVIGKECARALAYEFFWAVPKEEFSGRMYRLFERGQREEDVFVELLRMAGLEVHEVNANGEQFSYTDLGGHMAGSMDGAASGFPDSDGWHVLEFKTHSDKSFKDLVRKGVTESKPQHHAQMQIYMHWSGMKKACYMAVNKNDDSLHVEFVDYNELMAKGLIEKARNIIFGDRLPERIGGPDWYVCKWCNASDVCHRGEQVEKNCRTCKHSRALTNGAWTCAALNEGINKPEEWHECYQPSKKFS